MEDKRIGEDRNQYLANQQSENQDIASQERQNQERLNQERLNQERLNQERLNQERQNQERQNQERQNQERQNQERLNRERLYNQRREWEKIDRDSMNQGVVLSENNDSMNNARLVQPEIVLSDARYSSKNSNYSNTYPNDYYQGRAQEAKPQKKKKMKLASKITLIAISFCLFVGVFALLTVQSVEMISNYIEKKQPTQVVEDNVFAEMEKEIPLLQKTNEMTAVVTDVTLVVENVMPSVVSITTTMKNKQDMFGNVIGGLVSGGSGIIVGENPEELLIVTNNHVVADAAELTVQFIDGEEVLAQVKGRDEEMDIAIIAIQLKDLLKNTKESIIVAELGDSDSLKVGEPAIAIGNALGYGQSVTTGVISAVNRELTVEDVTNTLIQTDAAINPGNSGGALLNVKGEVIGINSNKIGGSAIEGMGYAIPISSAIPIIEELMVKETRYTVDEEDRGYLGVGVIDVIQEVSEGYGIPRGVFINPVNSGSGAEKAGLVKGDIIIAIEGESVTSGTELIDELKYYEEGQEVDLTIMRSSGSDKGYVEGTVTVMLGGKPND